MTHLTGKGLFDARAVGVLWILPNSFSGGAVNVPAAIEAFERARAAALEAADAEAGEEAELVKLLICSSCGCLNLYIQTIYRCHPNTS